MLRALVDAERHLLYRFFDIINHYRSLSLCSKIPSNEYSILKNITTNILSLKKPLEFRGAFLYSIKLGYALLAVCFFTFGSEPNGLFLAKSTKTGAATKIEE